ncbi:MAG: FG-GAP-like repeat-containing protein [Pseudomonadota bacterium]
MAPGADVAKIQLAFDGADEVVLDGAGAIRLRHAGGIHLTHAAPIVYQEIDDETVPVEGRFTANDEGVVSFSIGAYDDQSALVIDPQITLSTYFGGSLGESGNDVKVGPNEALIIVGDTLSVDLPGESDDLAGDVDGFVARLTPDGQALEFVTYLGGSGEEQLWALAVADDGAMALAGYTASPDFPTVNAYQETFRGGGLFESDSFVAKLNAEGNDLAFSTYLGGEDIFDESNFGFDFARDVAIDDEGNVYVTGETAAFDFPATQTLDGRACVGTDTGTFFGDGYLAKFTATGQIDYAFCFGAEQRDNGRGIALAADGSVHVVGFTSSSGFPVSAGALQTQRAGEEDVHITHFSADGTQILSSTFFGGSGEDFAQQVRLLSDGSRVIAGSTDSSDLPTTFGAFQREFAGYRDVLVTRVSNDATRLLFSTYLGGDDLDDGWGLEVDGNDAIYLAAGTFSLDFPLAAPLQSERTGAGVLEEVEVGDDDDTLAIDSTAGFINVINNNAREVVIGVGNRGLNRAYYFDAITGEYLRAQPIGSEENTTHGIALYDADIVQDGDVAIVVANSDAPSRVFLHENRVPVERFTLGEEIRDSRAVAVGSLLNRPDNGEIDIVLGNYLQPNLYFGGARQGFGAGEALFPGSEDTATVALVAGDVNGDFVPDIVEGNDGQLNAVYINVGGEAGFLPAQFIGNEADPTRAVALEDMDGDGDLDLLVGNDGAPDRIYFNDGEGVFANPISLDDQAASTSGIFGAAPFLGAPARIFAVDDQGGRVYTYQDGVINRFPMTQQALPVTAVEETFGIGVYQAGAVGAPLQRVSISLQDAYFTVLDPAGREALFSTLLGGAGSDSLSWGLALDGEGNALLAGTTRARDFPSVAPLQAQNNGLSDAFLTRIDVSDVALPNRLRYTTVVDLQGPGLDGITKVVLDWATLSCDESAAEELYDLRLSLIAGQALVDADTAIRDGLLQPLGLLERADPRWDYDLDTITLLDFATGTDGVIDSADATGVYYRVVPVGLLTEDAIVRIERFEDGVLVAVEESDVLAQYTIVLAGDCDADGVNAFEDNCLYARNPDQRDTDGDGIGNFCDADLNNDCLVNLQDLALLRGALQTGDEDADLNGDGVVNARDLRIARDDLFAAPGPSGTRNACSARP